MTVRVVGWRKVVHLTKCRCDIQQDNFSVKKMLISMCTCSIDVYWSETN